MWLGCRHNCGVTVRDDFYLAFEEKFRGDRLTIKNRLRVYLPMIEPLRTLYAENSVIDLGCGRGEWLELLTEFEGFVIEGVDIDDAMLTSAVQAGLPVRKQDALAALTELPDESRSVVTGFHIAEHLVFDDLRALIKDAYRVLKPGGLLILETPNPENIIVGTVDFYTDPTHHQPLPPNLLKFVVEYVGFCRSKIVRLQQPYDLERHRRVKLMDVLDGVSPDYAIVGQKSTVQAELSVFDPVFNKDYGLTLTALATKHFEQEALWMSESEQAVKRLECQLALVEERATQALLREQALLASKSWRYTKLLRKLFHWLKHIGEKTPR